MPKEDATDDPTSVRKMLEDFRSCRRSNLFDDQLPPLAPTRLQFTDSITEVSITKKRKCSDSFVSPAPSTMSIEDDSSMDIPPSPWDIRRYKADLVEAKARNVSLENQIQEMHSLRKHAEVIFENEKTRLLKDKERDQETIRALETRIATLKKREQEYKEELAECKHTMETTKLNLEKKILHFQKENAQLKDEIKQMELNSYNTSSTGDRRISELEAELTLSSEEIVALKASTKVLEEKIGEVPRLKLQLEIIEQELAESRQKIRELESEIQDTKESKELLEKQQHNLRRFHEMEREVNELKEENKNLKEAVHNKLILEEEVMDLRARQTGYAELEQKLSQLQVTKVHLENKLEQWHKLARDHCVGATPERAIVGPELLRIRIETLQQKELLLTADVSGLESRLKTLQHSKQAADAELCKLKKDVERLQTLNEQNNIVLKKFQKKLILVTRERDGYRSQLDMYEKELTVTSSAMISPQHQQQKLRIDALEKTVEGYRDLVKGLEAEVDKLSKVSDGGSELLEKIKNLEEERNALLMEKEQLMKRRDELEIELEYRALKGDFNPMKTKVVHLRMNPAAEAEKQHENEVLRLQQECDRLRERLKLMKEGQTEDVTEAVNLRLVACNTQELQELREQVKSYDTKIQRLKEAFKATSQEYREVCYMLLGYRIDRVKSNLYRLSSMYAESQEDHLMFKLTDGNPNLLETPYSATLEEFINLHLKHQHSIPVFLSAITLDLFNRQTFSSTYEPESVTST